MNLVWRGYGVWGTIYKIVTKGFGFGEGTTVERVYVIPAESRRYLVR